MNEVLIKIFVATAIASLIFTGCASTTSPLATANSSAVLEQSGAAYARGDYGAALEGFRKLAERGDARAQYNMGRMYSDGLGVPKDNVQAFAWYVKAADQGLDRAQNNVGWAYARAVGVSTDEALAVAWYRKAAEQGLAQAQLNLGVMYASGRGVSQDEQTAYFWWLLASAQIPEEGSQAAATNRDIAERRLTSVQLSAARSAARDWRPKISPRIP